MATESKFAATYGAALTDYLRHEEEAALYAVAELGKEMVRARIGPEVLLDIHARAFRNAVAAAPATDIATMAVRANELLLNGSMAFASNYQRLVDTLAEKEKRLGIVNSELEAFAFSVSHDLRAPLTHIGGFVELLKVNLGASVTEKGLRYMAVISSAADEMARMIAALLSYSRIGRAEMMLTTVDLTHVVAESRQALQGECEGRDISWQIGALPEVKGDRMMLKTVMTNLIANALKFTRPRPQAIIEVGSMSGVREDLFFVRDNGVGFDMRHAGQLFGLFRRLHGEDEFPGTGVGLANVRRIIQRHGGRTWAEGAIDQGATIYCSLPKGWERGPG